MPATQPEEPPGPDKLRRELIIFFAGLAGLCGLAIVILRAVNADERDPALAEHGRRMTLEIGVSVGAYLAAAVMVGLRLRWGAVLGAGWAVLNVVLFLASIAQRSANAASLGVPMLIWTLIALTIVRRTRLYWNATAPQPPPDAT